MEKQATASRGRERITLSADLSDLCHELQETDRVLRELCEKKTDGTTDPALLAHYAEVWGKHRRLKQQVWPRLLAELEVDP